MDQPILRKIDDRNEEAENYREEDEYGNQVIGSTER